MSRRHALTRRTALKALGAAGIVGAAGTGISFAANGSSDGTSDGSGDSSSPHLAWMKKYDLDVSFADIAALDDGGYVVGGSTPAADDAAHQFWLAALDDHGEIRWSDTYGDGTLNAVVPASDGGFFLVGSQYAESDSGYRFPEFARIVKTKSTSDGAAPGVDWTKTFDDRTYELEGKTHKIKTDFVDAVSADGGVVALGTYVTDLNHPWTLKFDVDGTIDWETRGKGYYDLNALDLVYANDGGFLGIYTEEGKGSDVQKLDADGNEQWTDSYPMPFFGGGAQDESGTFGFFGRMSSVVVRTINFRFLSTDSSGETRANKGYRNDTYRTVAGGTFATDDGFLLAGTSTIPSNTEKHGILSFLEVDPDGTRLRSFSVQRDGENLAYADMTPVHGGYVVIGSSDGKPMTAELVVPPATRGTASRATAGRATTATSRVTAGRTATPAVATVVPVTTPLATTPPPMTVTPERTVPEMMRATGGTPATATTPTTALATRAITPRGAVAAPTATIRRTADRAPTTSVDLFSAAVAVSLSGLERPLSPSSEAIDLVKKYICRLHNSRS